MSFNTFFFIVISLGNGRAAAEGEEQDEGAEPERPRAERVEDHAGRIGRSLGNGAQFFVRRR